MKMNIDGRLSPSQIPLITYQTGQLQLYSSD